MLLIHFGWSANKNLQELVEEEKRRIKAAKKAIFSM